MKLEWMAPIFLLFSVGCSATIKSLPPTNVFSQAHTQVELVSPSKNVVPGKSLWVGLRMKMDHEWHVYWKNPGDSGLPPSIEWKLPQGFTAGEIQWPYPKMIRLPPLTSYGYEKEVILFAAIQVPENISGNEVLLGARVNWLACKIECLPGRADLELRLPVVSSEFQISEQDHDIERAFRETRKKWPVTVTRVEVQAYEQEDDLFFEIGPLALVKPESKIYFYPDRPDLIDHSSEQVLASDESVYVLTVKKSSLKTKSLIAISGILVNQNGWENVDYPQALVFESDVRKIKFPVVEMSLEAKPLIPLERSSMTLVLACFFAVLGGLILNLMPCVLPVLSLKILHLLQHTHDRSKLFLNGAVFSAGVIVSFWILALALISLRSLGSAIGWGFQFQSPAFVVFIAALLFVFSLNLFGLFEVGLGLTKFGNASLENKGYGTSFLSGVFATIVATPCTAPFMGTALGFALSRSGFEAFLVFTFLGVGMALPVLVLSSFPKLLRMVPRPGPWMNALKNILGFVLMACVIWLVWVFGLQKGIVGVVAMLVSFLFLSVGLYFYGQGQINGKRSLFRIFSIVLFMIAGYFAAWHAVKVPVDFEVGGDIEKRFSENVLKWRKFSPGLLEDLIQGGKPVFLDFTAAWCLSCQVNEKIALSDRKVIDAFKGYGIIPVKADWTNSDPAITEALAGYGRNSIPLYVLYPGNDASAVFLPEIITPDIVLEHFKKHINTKGVENEN